MVLSVGCLSWPSQQAKFTQLRYWHSYNKVTESAQKNTCFCVYTKSHKLLVQMVDRKLNVFWGFNLCVLLCVYLWQSVVRPLNRYSVKPLNNGTRKCDKTL